MKSTTFIKTTDFTLRLIPMTSSQVLNYLLQPYLFISFKAESDCSPIVYNRDLYKKVSAFNSSVTLNPDDVAIPCGMIAYTIFNDTYNLYSPQGN